jgi:hypothetical protein
MGFSQSFFRIKADFSVKTKFPDNSSDLRMGTVYYDKNIKKILYCLTFPEKEQWLLIDTFIYKIQDKKIVSTQKIPAIAESSIFHLALNSNMTDYGLKKANFTILDVEKIKDMVITTWDPPLVLKKIMGKIMVSTKDKKLFGIVFYTPKNEIVRKQFFEEYQLIRGLAFPGKIVQITYDKIQEIHEITTYKNIVINELENESHYNMSIDK